MESKALEIENSGKEVHRKYKGWGHTQSQVRKIGNRLTSVRLMGRLEGSRNSPETQGSEQTGDDRYHEGLQLRLWVHVLEQSVSL